MHRAHRKENCKMDLQKNVSASACVSVHTTPGSQVFTHLTVYSTHISCTRAQAVSAHSEQQRKRRPAIVRLCACRRRRSCRLCARSYRL